MKLDFKSLAFGYSLENGVSTPAWETALGQGAGYKLKDLDTIDELVKGMVYKAVAPKSVSFKKGRGGAVVSGDSDNAALVIAAVFDKVFINEHQIHGGKFIMVIIKDDSEHHRGRLKLKYGLDNTYTNSEGVIIKNRDFQNAVSEQLGLAADACWFVYDISVENQDMLRLRTIIVNKNGPMTYSNSEALHSVWDVLIDTDLKSCVNADEVQDNRSEIVSEDISNSMSIEELGRILAEMYNNAPVRNQSNAIRMFGVKYGGVICDNNYSSAAIVKASGINSSYDAEVSKGVSIYKSIRDNEYGVHFADYTASDANDSKVLGGYNKIYYGAPGCGKSFIVNKKLDDANVPEENRIRVTFHPEYANCDFVGQILPTIEKKIDAATGAEKELVKYIFNPGPFTLALKRARETNDMVYLIIEEINRGNAAAIFGDLFQLLDREKDMTKPNWGESEYPICNVNIQKYLGMDEGKSTVIPSNLTILATMNTSDQSVFTLDTAFKRRWSFEQISNNIEKDTKHEYKGWYVPGTNVTLEKFLTVINIEILKHKITSEDKRMGKYFISKDCLTENPCNIQDVKTEAEMFAYKVLEYIWNDVCKIGRDEWFDTVSITTLEDLIEAFVKPSSGDNPLSVFKSITF